MLSGDDLSPPAFNAQFRAGDGSMTVLIPTLSAEPSSPFRLGFLFAPVPFAHVLRNGDERFKAIGQHQCAPSVHQKR
jgi:hypothetical protein